LKLSSAQFSAVSANHLMTLAEDMPTIGSRQILIALASNQALIFRPNICDRSQSRALKLKQ